jgi:mannosyltransferase
VSEVRQSVPVVRDLGNASRDLSWRWWLPFTALVVVAAMVRFALLRHQSLWFDEVVSLTLVKQPFGAMLHDITRTESTPPLYYALLWVWVRIFGTTVFALRSLSACLGVLTVAVLYLASRLRFSGGAALVAGALAATDPMLIWYSQETRAYALVTLLVACTVYFFLRAGREVSRWAVIGWGVSSAAAIATHYFAFFIVVPEMAVMVYRYRDRLPQVAAAAVIPLATGAALLPLAVHQRNTGHTSFIATLSLHSRVQQTVNEYLFGPYSVSSLSLLAVCVVIAGAAFFSIHRRANSALEHECFVLFALSVCAFFLPVVVARGAFFYRNLIVVLPPLLIVGGVAFVPRRTRTIQVLVGLAAAAALLIPTVVIANRPALEREDWRDIPSLIGPPVAGLAVITYPRFEYIPLIHYRPHLHPVLSGTLHVRELVIVGRPQLTRLRLPHGFIRVEDLRLGTLRLVRLRASSPVTIDVASFHLRPLLRLLSQTGFDERTTGQDATLLVEPTQR